MSGGSYDYAFQKIDDLSEAIIDRAGSSIRRQLFADLLYEAAVAAKAIEWCDSGDTSFPDDEAALQRFFTLARGLCDRESELTHAELKQLAALKMLHRED